MIVGAHDWTGDLAASGLVLPLNPRRTVKASFPQYALNAFSYGTAVKKLYGAPVVIENIGLVVNTRLAKVPTSFAQLQASALAFKKKKAGNIAIAVQQGAAGDAYHMYPPRVCAATSSGRIGPATSIRPTSGSTTTPCS